MLGGINTDHLVRGRELPRPGMSVNGDVFLEGPGGKGANAAVAAARLGARTALIGRVGHDDRERAILVSLRREGVDVARVGIDPHASTGATTTALGAQAGLPRRRELESYLDDVRTTRPGASRSS